MLTHALALAAAGYSVLRAESDGTKAPVGQWKQYQTTPADEKTLARWFGGEHPGLGIITGRVSGNLEMVEFEGRAVTENVHLQFFELLTRAGHADLLARITTGYTEQSPSGGLHFFYRVDPAAPVGGNQKLASRYARDNELTDDERDLLARTGKRATRTLIETRGEGGFVVCAPSNGTTHPTGRPWRLLTGTPATVPLLTGAERADLLCAARVLDQLPTTPGLPDPRDRPAGMAPGDLYPGEDYNQRATWADVLRPAGWTLVHDQGTRATWRRPGKSRGVSAYTGGCPDLLYVFSSSTELPTGEGLSKWRAYALLHHAGDFPAAASALRRQGYGTPAAEPSYPATESARDWSTLTAGTATPPDPDEAVSGDPVARPPAELPAVLTMARSDDGNSLALADTYGTVIRFCPERGQWLNWTGTGWEWCGADGGHIREYAKVIARQIAADDPKGQTHKRHSLSDKGISSMVRMTRTHPRVVIRISDLDAHPYELNTPDGVVDLYSGRVMPHDPARLHTRIATVTPDFGADPTAWRTFLDQTFDGHPELPGYMQRLVGYSAIGAVREHILPFCFGSGGNGKGVFLETVSQLLGNYGHAAPNNFLMAQTYSQHPTEVARLSGARMVLCSEVNQSDKFDEGKIKYLTGGDTITARFMRQDEFSFRPTHKLWLAGNFQPAVESGGPGFWRRLRLIPFDNTVDSGREVFDLREQLTTRHGPAIMAWIVAGAVTYLRHGLMEPDSVRNATNEYAHDQDSLMRFVEDCCYISGSDLVKTNTKNVRDAYAAYCREQDLRPITQQAFGRAIRDRYKVRRDRSHGQRFYLGLALAGAEPPDGHRAGRSPAGPE